MQAVSRTKVALAGAEVVCRSNLLKMRCIFRCRDINKLGSPIAATATLLSTGAFLLGAAMQRHLSSLRLPRPGLEGLKGSAQESVAPQATLTKGSTQGPSWGAPKRADMSLHERERSFFFQAWGLDAVDGLFPHVRAVSARTGIPEDFGQTPGRLRQGKGTLLGIVHYSLLEG